MILPNVDDLLYKNPTQDYLWHKIKGLTLLQKFEGFLWRVSAFLNKTAKNKNSGSKYIILIKKSKFLNKNSMFDLA